jgi:hypothetical protein
VGVLDVELFELEGALRAVVLGFATLEVAPSFGCP